MRTVIPKGRVEFSHPNKSHLKSKSAGTISTGRLLRLKGPGPTPNYAVDNQLWGRFG